MGEIIKRENLSKRHDIKSGIYKINFPNGKYYIGLSRNIGARVLQHEKKARDNEDNLPVYNAIRKFFEDCKLPEIEILEEIDADDIEKMKEREIYWISFYYATDREHGYNVTEGGDYRGDISGINNISANFDENSLRLVKEAIKNSTKTFEEIAEEFGVSKRCIGNINQGRTYFDKNESYPLRDENISIQIAHEKQRYLSKNDVLKIHDLLANSSMSMQEIADQFGTQQTIISAINVGKSYRYQDLDVDFPIRKNNKLLSTSYVRQICDLLAKTKLSYKEIAEKTGLSLDQITNINAGKSYAQDDIKYPIRARTKRKLNSSAKFNEEQIKEIVYLLKDTDTSQTEIARHFEVSNGTIYQINVGNSYFNPELEYPIRKIKRRKK